MLLAARVRCITVVLGTLSMASCASPAATDASASDGTPTDTSDAVDEPLPPLPVTEPEHVAACARLAACFPEGAQSLSVCASSFVYFVGDSQIRELSLLVRCVNAAGPNCDAVRACTHTGTAPPACDPATAIDRCDGNVSVLCRRSTRLEFRVDCAALGQSCSLDRLRRPTCGFGSCSEGQPAFCDRDRLMQCIDGVLSFADCARAGMRCVAVPTARCAGRGAPCNAETFGDGCSGGVLRGCLGGFAANIDCAAILPQLTCVQVSGMPPACARTATPVCMADPINGSVFPEHCDGSAIVYCLDGLEARLDCMTLGLARCTQVMPAPPRCAP